MLWEKGRGVRGGGGCHQRTAASGSTAPYGALPRERSATWTHMHVPRGVCLCRARRASRACGFCPFTATSGTQCRRPESHSSPVSTQTVWTALGTYVPACVRARCGVLSFAPNRMGGGCLARTASSLTTPTWTGRLCVQVRPERLPYLGSWDRSKSMFGALQELKGVIARAPKSQPSDGSTY